MAIVYLGVGSNLGDRTQNIQNALALLEKNGINILRLSSMIETEPVGGPPQGLFINCVLKIQTELVPEELLKELSSIENQLGRTRTVQNGPRTIDIDILLYDDLILSTPQLTIPHPRMLERSFVMEPLKEIDPVLAEQLIHARY